MVQKQIAFEKTKLQQEALALDDISHKWAKRLGEQQQLPVPLSITWLRWWFEIISPPKCVVGEANIEMENFWHILKTRLRPTIPITSFSIIASHYNTQLNYLSAIIEYTAINTVNQSTPTTF
jgi:hypothetical protein